MNDDLMNKIAIAAIAYVDANTKWTNHPDPDHKLAYAVGQTYTKLMDAVEDYEDFVDGRSVVDTE